MFRIRIQISNLRGVLRKVLAHLGVRLVMPLGTLPPPQISIRDTHVSLRLRPLSSAQRCKGYSLPVERQATTGLILQGPIMHWKDFTLESVRLYRDVMRVNELVLVTSLQTEKDREVAKRIIVSGCTVLDVNSGMFPGPANVNLQMEKTVVGLRHLDNLGVKFCLKTRTDQRLGDDLAIEALHYLHATFPPKSSALKGRIIFSSLNSFLYRMYGPSDMFQFGLLQDLLLYWGGEPDYRRLPRDSGSLREWSLGEWVEVGLYTGFLRRIDWDIKWTLQDYWKSLAHTAIIVDSASLDQWWPKYTSLEERWKSNRGATLHEEISFSKWLAILNGGMEPDEAFLDQQITNHFFRL